MAKKQKSGFQKFAIGTAKWIKDVMDLDPIKTGVTGLLLGASIASGYMLTQYTDQVKHKAVDLFSSAGHGIVEVINNVTTDKVLEAASKESYDDYTNAQMEQAREVWQNEQETSQEVTSEEETSQDTTSQLTH